MGLLLLIVFSSGVIAQPFEEKLKGGLNPRALSTETENVFLIVPSALSDVPTIQNELSKSNATFSFQRIGSVVIAKLPSNKIPGLVQQSAVKEVWPDLEVNAIDEEALQQINARTAWELGYLGDNTKIAVLDSGIDASHPVFQNRVIAAHNFSNSPTVTDILGHGTHVAGIAAGFGDANGVAPHALLLNGKVLNDQGSGTFTTVINGINWAAEQGAHVINLSLGASSHDTDSPLNRAVRDAMNAGIVVAVASGNCWNECPSSSCGSFRGVTLPGNTKEALTIGAVTKQNEHACFSSGENISGIGIKPDLVAPGVGIVSSIPGGGLGTKSGTSMATPFAAGAAALAKQAHPSFSALQIKALLQNISTDFGEQGKDILFGSGLLDLAQIESMDTNSPDENGSNPDENHEGDINGFEGQFFFWGPNELVKNQDGNFDVEHQGQGDSSQEIGSQDQNFKDTLVEFVVLDEFGTIVDYNAIGPIELVDINNYHFLNTFTPKRVGRFTVQAFIYQNGELLQSFGGKDSNLGAATAEKNVWVTLPSDLLQIQPFSIPPQIEKGNPFSVQITVDSNGDLDTNAFLEILFINDQNNVAEVFDTNTVPIFAHQQTVFLIEKQLFIPSGDYNVVATVFFENQKKSVAHASHVTIGNALEMQSLAFGDIYIHEPFTISFVLTNNSSFDVHPTAFVYILDGNRVVDKKIDNQLSLLPNEQRPVPIPPWTPKLPAQDYNITVKIELEDQTIIQEGTFRIIDNDFPTIENISFKPVTWQNGFEKIKVRVSDYSPVRQVSAWLGQEEILLHKISGTDTNAEFAGTFLNVQNTGGNQVDIQAYDLFDNRSMRNFTFSVQDTSFDCNNRLSLIVRDNDSVPFSPSGQNWLQGFNQLPECFLEWDTKELGLPSLELLQRFKPVFWSTGNHFGPSLDENETALLKSFVQQGGRLFLEGSDVSSEHGFDSFAYNILHAEFSLEIGQDENFGNNQNQGSGGPWWDNAYAYKRCLDITANQTGMDTNTVIDVSVNDFNIADLFLQGKTRADFADVRVVHNDANQIDRVIHTRFLQDLNAGNYTDFNRLSFKLQAEIPNQSTSTGEYCIYYGNPTAISPPEDYSNVFVAGDSFNRPNNASLGSQWNETYATNDIFSVNNNMLKLDTDAGGGNGCAQFNAPYLTSDSVLQWNTYQNGSSTNMPYMKTVQNTDSGYPIGLGYHPPEQNMVLEEWSTGPRASYNQTWANNSFAVFKNDFVDGSGGQMLTAAMTSWTPRISYAHAKPPSFAAFTCGFGTGTKFWMDSLIVRNFRDYTKTVGAEHTPNSLPNNQNWWNPDFKKKKPILISVGSENWFKDSTIRIPIDFSVLSLQPGLGDLRIVDESQNVELDRLVDGTSETTDGNAYFRLPYDLAENNDFNSTFFLYYDNPATGAPPEANVCHDSCDGFEDEDFTSNPAWSVVTYGGTPSISVQSGVKQSGNYAVLFQEGNAGASYGLETPIIGTARAWNAWIYGTRLDLPNSQGISFFLKNANNSKNMRLQANVDTGEIRFSDTDGHLNSSGVFLVAEKWYKFEILYVSQSPSWTMNVYDSDGTTLLASHTQNGFSGLTINSTELQVQFVGSRTGDFYADNATYGPANTAVGTGEEITQQDSNSSGSNVSRFQIRFFGAIPSHFRLPTATIDYNFSPYADAVLDANQGIPIAGWDENHLALIGWQNVQQQSKTLFLSLSLDALSFADRNALLADSIQWLLKRPSINVQPTKQNPAQAEE